MNTHTLLLNCFPVKLLPLDYDFPYFSCDSWLASTKKLKSDYGEYSWYRLKEDNGRVRALLLNGPERPKSLDVMNADLTLLPDLGKSIISRSISRYFSARDLMVSRTNFGTTVLRKTPEFSQGFLDVFCGVSFQVRHPFVESPEQFATSVQWEVKTSFNSSIAEPKLKGMSEGMPVLYQPAPGTDVGEDMRPFIHRYLGHVYEVRSQTEAVINCKDHVLRRVSLTDLVLEASPAVIREYERRLGLRQSSRSLWYKLQELSFVLNKHGRRNSTVLKDRLQAVRAFLGSSSKEQLIIPVACFQEGSISLGLSPTRVEVA